MQALTVPASFGPSAAPEWIELASAGAGEPDLRLEVRSGARPEPSALVLLAAGIARRQAEGRRTRLDLDAGDEAAATALRDLDFFAELGIATERGLPRPRAGGVPLRRLRDLASVRALADRTRDFLEASFPGLSPTTLRAAHFVFEELGANVVQHSERPATGFGLASADPASGRIQIAFADAGVGFRASLQRSPELRGRIEDDAQAIQLALDRRVSRGGPGNLGIGLSFLASLAERIDGDLWIASGSALLRLRTVASGRVASVVSTARWEGAWVCLDAPVPGWEADPAAGR